MENVQIIKSLIGESNAIKRMLAAFKKYKGNPKHYDKIDKGFNIDSRFAAHKGFEIRVDTYCGTYGDSSCSRELTLDDRIFNRHLLKVLNADFDAIMEKVAESIQAEAIKYKEQAQKELEHQLAIVNSI
jgi:hypothetical protein